MSPGLEALGRPVAVEGDAREASIPRTQVGPDASVAVWECINPALPVQVHWLRLLALCYRLTLWGGCNRRVRSDRLRGFSVHLTNRRDVLSLWSGCEIGCV